jgi:putative ABC transport system permease protein
VGWTRYLRRSRWDAERARELESYLAHEYDDNRARGLSHDEALRAARLKLGNATLVREEIYSMNTLGFVESLWKDLTYGARLLRRNPTFAVVAILTLALGTGANTAIFQIVDAVRLRALPVSKPNELVAVSIDTHDKGRTGRFISRRPIMTNPLWERIEKEQQAFSSILAWGSTRFDMAAGGESQMIFGMWVSGRFFETLGVPALIGRVLTAADDRRGCGDAGLVLSHGFWQRQFAGDPNVIGRTLSLDGRPFEVVGVTPASFFGVEVGRTFDVAAPLCAEPLVTGAQSALDQPDYWFLDIMGRLKPGWTLEQASAHLKAISPELFRGVVPPRYNPEDVKAYLDFTLIATPAGTGVSSLRRAYATPLWLLLGFTGLVLLIACANLANLMLARATARAREISIRLAIGASRRRIIRQMLAESLLMAAIGTAAGLLLAGWLSRTLVSFLSTDGNRVFVTLTTDWRVFGFAAALAVSACLLFGLAPAWHATGVRSRENLQASDRTATDSHERFGARRVLVIVQVALSLVLIAGALLFGRSLRNLLTLDTGFRSDGVIVANLDLRGANVPQEGRRALFTEIMERMRALPGVAEAAEAFIVPVSGSGWNNLVVIGGAVQQGLTNVNSVGAGYFHALGTPILAGRAFDRTDTPESSPVAIVNESFARQYFAGRDPLGQSFQIQAPAGVPRPLYRVVGLVKDTKYTDLREPFGPIVYFAASQDKEHPEFLQIIMKSDTAASSVTTAATRELSSIAPAITVQYLTMRTIIRDSLVSERLMATLSGFFGGLAVLIATVGLYGVMSYMVTRRRREIGIRIALGADAGSVVRMVVAEAAMLLAAGIVVGTVLAIVSARSASTLLFGLEPWDPSTVAMGIVTLTVVSLLASWLPARRAARFDPTIALRQD